LMGIGRVGMAAKEVTLGCLLVLRTVRGFHL